jgi:Ca2+-binding RTX toxin-like protein
MAAHHGTDTHDSLYGTDDSNYFYGEDGDDEIFGKGGYDEIRGGGGNDIIDTGGGNDKAWGGAGNDVLKGGGGGSDFFYGEDGNDVLDGAGQDWTWLSGGNGNDRLLSGGGSDRLYGDAGNDVLVWQSYGQAGHRSSQIYGGTGSDTLHIDSHAWIAGAGGAKSDPVAAIVMDERGTGGKLYFQDALNSQDFSLGREQAIICEIETIYAGTRQNAAISYVGGFADMAVLGGAKDDAFRSGPGSETFKGGGGQDGFIFDLGKRSLGTDTIVGFDKGEDFFVVQNSEGFSFRQVEKAGHTLITATDKQGHAVLSLDVDAVGLPLFSQSTEIWI